MNEARRLRILQDALGWHLGALACINFNRYVESLNLLDDQWVRNMDSLLERGVFFREWLFEAFVWVDTPEGFDFWEKISKKI